MTEGIGGVANTSGTGVGEADKEYGTGLEARLAMAEDSSYQGAILDKLDHVVLTGAGLVIPLVVMLILILVW